MRRETTFCCLPDPEAHTLATLSAAPIKRTAVERQVNTQIVFLFGLLLALSVGSTIGASIQMARQAIHR